MCLAITQEQTGHKIIKTHTSWATELKIFHNSWRSSESGSFHVKNEIFQGCGFSPETNVSSDIF